LQPKKTEQLEIFAARLKAAMARKDVTLQQVAEACKVAVSTVGAWTQGMNWPKVTIQPALAAYLDESVEFLIHGISVSSTTGKPVITEYEQASRFRTVSGSPRMQINPRYAPPDKQPTRDDCVNYFERYVRSVEQVPGAIGHTWIELNRHFVIEEIARSLPPISDREI